MSTTTVYGAGDADPKEFITPKDPDDVVPYTLNLANEMSALGDDTISSVTVSAETGLTVDSSSNTATAITAVVSGGTAGRTYTLAYQAVTTAGYRLNYTGVVRVASR